MYISMRRLRVVNENPLQMVFWWVHPQRILQLMKFTFRNLDTVWLMYNIHLFRSFKDSPYYLLKFCLMKYRIKFDENHVFRCTRVHDKEMMTCLGNPMSLLHKFCIISDIIKKRIRSINDIKYLNLSFDSFTNTQDWH